MQNLLAELLGTMLLIVLGDGVVANVVLTGTKGEKSGWIVITTGWGIAVAMAAYAVGRISGAHLNPALTLALATIGSFAWADVPGYIAAQLVGAFLGAIIVWLAYRPHFAVTDDKDGKLAVFATGPEIRNTSANLTAEIIGTAALPSATWPSPATRRRWCGPTTSTCPRCSAAGCSRSSWACWFLV